MFSNLAVMKDYKKIDVLFKNKKFYFLEEEFLKFNSFQDIILNNKNRNPMRVITEAHRYELANFENKDGVGQVLQFIEKQPNPENLSELITINDGTTNEEVIEVLIDRLNVLNKKFPCRENSLAITKLDEALLWLNKRTADRIKRNVEGKQLK